MATATTKKKSANQRVKGDTEKPYDAAAARCPECGASVHMYVPPDRLIGGPIGYPALLIHYETAHTTYVGGKPDGWSTPPPPPEGDQWETDPPARDDWQPIDVRLAERNLPQSDAVWPPVHVPERP